MESCKDLSNSLIKRLFFYEILIDNLSKEDKNNPNLPHYNFLLNERSNTLKDISNMIHRCKNNILPMEGIDI